MKRQINLRVIAIWVLTAALMTALSCTLYSVYVTNWVRDRIGSSTEETPTQILPNPTERELEYILKYQYVLYKELCVKTNMQEGGNDHIRYQDLFFEKTDAEEKFPEYLAYLLYMEDEDRLLDEENRTVWKDQYDNEVYSLKEMAANALSSLEQDGFSQFNSMYDYWISWERAKNGRSLLLTNTQDEGADPKLSDYAFVYRITYDEFGVPAISDFLYAESDAEQLRKDLNAVLHKNPVRLLVGSEDFDERTGNKNLDEAVWQATTFQNPVGCSITIGMTKEKSVKKNWVTNEDMGVRTVYGAFSNSGVRLVYLGLLFLAGIAGFSYLNPVEEEKRALRKLVRMPLELLVIPVLILLLEVDGLYYLMTVIYLGRGGGAIAQLVGSLFLYFLAAWYIGGCIGEMRTLGIAEYGDRRILILRIWHALKRKVGSWIQSYREIDLKQDLREKLRWIVLLNGIVVMVFCCFWFAGGLGVVLYSVALYFLAVKYLSAVQGEYRVLQQMTQEIATGNLKYETEEHLGVFEPLKEDLVSIRNGFDAAVQEEVKSQRMKTELITNVSHDLKTPLTAIITYINLLKEKNLSQEQQSQYLETLEKKSLRLKTLIEDLFEVSKANSGNVQLDLQTCDLVNLIKQVSLEMQDKLEEKHLTVRLLLPEEKVPLLLDSQKTFRIYENLFGNVAKYAMEGTRVYVGLLQTQETVSVVIKNITEAELSISPEELTERFVRGDASRGSVEGSGLGLAIVRSFTELQGGKLDIEIDGDLFKVTTVWKK